MISGSSAAPRCSIVIPTWKRATSLSNTLSSLALQTYRDFEVIVVSDGEDAATRELANSYRALFPVRWIFHPQNLGQASARNTGATAAQGEVLLFIDDDTTAEPDLVSRHLEHYGSPDAGNRIAVYGKVVEDRRSDLNRWIDRFMQEVWEQTLEAARASVGAIGEASCGDDFERAVSFGVNASIRREEFQRAKGFNPRLRDQAEDGELGLRLYRSGVQFQVEQRAVVHHRNTKSMTEHFQRAWYLGGRTDCLRVLELGERSPQTRQLSIWRHGSLLKRLLAKSFYHFASFWNGLSAVLARSANLTGSRLLFGAWARVTRPSLYWQGVRSAGLKPEALNALGREPNCALMFHRLAVPESADERAYCLSPQRFHRYLQHLAGSGYQSVGAKNWLQGASSSKRTLLTFDDGYQDLYTELPPAMATHQIKPLIFLVADPDLTTNIWDQARGFRSRRLLTREQIHELQRQGAEFGSHTVSHRWLPDLNDAELRREVADSKRMLEDTLGTAVTAFSYPYGGVDQRVRAAVAEAGYELAFTTSPGANGWNDSLCLHRADVNDTIGFADFWLKARTGYGTRQWFGARMRTLETELPTRTLRRTVSVIRRAVRPAPRGSEPQSRRQG